MNLLKEKSNGSSVWQYNYDANGNPTERGNRGSWNESAKRYEFNETTGELWKYSYDLSNRLVKVERSEKGTSGLTEIARYTYDIRGLRVLTEKPNRGSEYSQYDESGNLIWKQNAEGKTDYVWAGSRIWAEIRTSKDIEEIYYHHTDHVGTTEVITNAAGTIVWEANYEAFGSVISSKGTVNFTASYTGKELDSDTGLY